MSAIKSCQDLGLLILNARKSQNLTQKELAALCGTGQRLIVDLEKGKPTCAIDKALTVARTLGINLTTKTKP